MFQLRVSIGAAIVVLYALGAGAAPPRAPKAMPTPAPEAVNPDEPPNDEVVKLLMDPNARGTGPAFSAARAVALARGDDRKWHQLLRREALSAFNSRASDKASASAARESLIWRLEADRPRRASVEVDIAFSLVIAGLQGPLAEWARAANPDDASRESPDPARDSYAAVFALRDRLGAKPRETLPFVCPQQTGDWHPTSRDVVSHLYAALLTSGPRRPLRGATELQRLLGPLPKGPDAEESLPAKACAVLDDLERWHLSVTSPALNHRAGALQARLERLRILSQWFPVREDQALIVGNLEGLLPAYRDDAAWAEGMAQLALFVNQSAERPEAPLVIAEEGARAYPGSPGGERCSVIARALRLEIDDPELELSPERGGQPLGSALFVSHGRAASLRFRAFPEPADLECVARAEESERAGPTEGPGEVAIEWTAKLPEPASGERSTTSIPLPLTRKGLYRLQFGREALPLLMPAFSILVTDIALLTRRRDREVEVWTVEASSGAPVRNAEVRLILRDGSPETVSATVSSSKTDAEGRAVFELPKGGSAEARFMVLARRGDDLASAFVDSNEGRPPKAVPAASRDSKAPLLSFLLDRPSGVPGEVVRWRAGLYCALGPRSESLFQPVSGATLTLSLRDGTDGAGGTLEPLSTQEVSSGPFGEASGEIAFPKLAEGSEKGWTFEVTTKALCGEVAAPRPNTATASVRLPPRMVPAGIEIALTEPTLVSGAPTLLEGIAARGGVPLPDALVRWEITAPRTVIRWAESRDRSREDRNPWGRVAEGVLSTDSQGRFSIPVVGPVSRGARDGFDGLLVRVELRSLEGETAAVRRNLTVVPAAVALNISGPTIYRKGEQIVMRISRRGALSGLPSPGESIAKVQRIAQFDPIWVPGTFGSWSYGGPRGTARALEESAFGIDVREDRVTSDATGESRLSMSLDPGFYRLVVTTADEAGRKTQASRAFVVDGPSLHVPVPLTLLVDERRPGPSRIFAKGSGAQVVLEISGAGAPVERRSVAANGNGVIEVNAPANESVNVMAYTVRDGRLLGYDSVLQRRDDRLALSLDAASPSLEVRATTRDGAPVSGVALHVVAVPTGSRLGLRDPFHGDSPYPASSRRPQLSTLAQQRPVTFPGATSSDWYLAEIPETPSEPDPLHSDTSSPSCRLGSRPTYARLARNDRSGFSSDFRSSSTAVDVRRHDPAAVWAPGLVTDARGIARTPFHAEPGTSYSIFATAIAPDGRTGHLGQMVRVRDESVPTSVSR